MGFSTGRTVRILDWGVRAPRTIKQNGPESDSREWELYRRHSDRRVISALVQRLDSVMVENSVPDANMLAPALALLLLSGLLLFGTFLTVSFVWVRAMRRLRRDMARRRSAPTPTDDIWSMHKLPGERDEPPTYTGA